MTRRKPFSNDLYVISSSVGELKRAVDDGAAIVQLRDKTGDEATVLEKARELLEYRKIRPFVFILNDDPVLAVKVGADGVHVGQDMSTLEARAIVGEEMIIGKTTHNLEQGRQAIKDGADYISTGPVYATPTKPGRAPVGLAYVREAAEHLEQGKAQLLGAWAGELLAEELRLAQQNLSEITGEFTSDDLLGRIFSSFCIGK